jgi:hypothetical protein
MGGSGGKKTKRPQVQHAAPLDYGTIMTQAGQAAKESYRDQLAAQIEAYPQLESLQLGTVSKLAGNLDNAYTQDARNQIGDALSYQGSMEGAGDQLQGIGGLIGDFALQNYLASGPTGAERNIQALGQGSMGVRADQVVAPGQNAVRQIAADNVGAGNVGDALMAQAAQRAQSTGRLSAEAERDAVQAARAGMGSRGLGTGSGATAVELLNRDRFSRARQAEDLAFAAGVQQQDIGRQFQNVANRMTAAQANQSRDQFLTAAGMDAQMANQTANMNQREMNRAFMLNANQAFNTGTMQRRDQAAQQAALGGNLLQAGAAQYGNAANLGLAGASAMLATDPYARAMGLGLQSSGNTQANLSQGIGATYGNALNAGLGAASFNANMIDTRANSQLNNWAAMRGAQMQAGAMNQAATMGMIGNIGSSIFSDKRMKKDIKPLGKAGSVLGLTAYEYKYKGEDEKRVGFMAQDVQKVLPEAVEERTVQGKKRLAIKPAVIGAALAQELTQAKAA